MPEGNCQRDGGRAEERAGERTEVSAGRRDGRRAEGGRAAGGRAAG